jgi:hypothetical protein
MYNKLPANKTNKQTDTEKETDKVTDNKDDRRIHRKVCICDNKNVRIKNSAPPKKWSSTT